MVAQAFLPVRTDWKVCATYIRHFAKLNSLAEFSFFQQPVCWQGKGLPFGFSVTLAPCGGVDHFSSPFFTLTWMSSKSCRLTAINSAAIPIMMIWKPTINKIADRMRD